MPVGPHLLLTGASGFLGTVLRPRLSERYTVFPVSRRDRKDWVALDLVDDGAVRRAVKQFQPAIVVHAAAWTSVDGCERDQATAYAENVLATANLVNACKDLDRPPRFLFISSDQFYDGPGPHREDALPTPRNVYALTKLWAESEAARMPNVLILRSNFFGLGRRPGDGLARWLLDSLAAGREVKLFDDVLFNPLYIEDYADLVCDLIASNAGGVVNVGAAGGGLSKAAFARALAARFGLSTLSAVVGSVDDAKLPAVRPKDMRMDITRLRGLLPERTIPGIEAGIERMHRQAAAVSAHIGEDASP